MKNPPANPHKVPRHGSAMAAPLAAALCTATRAVVERQSFAAAAGVILGQCQSLLGAEFGFVALAHGKGFKVAVPAASPLPAALRRLGGEVARSLRTVFANDLAKSPAAARRGGAENALVAPLLLTGEVAGLLGLVNKAGGFGAADVGLAQAFAELATVALQERRIVADLESKLRLVHHSERQTRRVADSLREATVELTRSLDRETVLLTLLDRLRSMVPFDRASVMLLEESSQMSVRAIFDGQQVMPLAPERRARLDAGAHPIVHGILTTGKAVVIPDVRARPDWSLPTDGEAEACWMGVPLFARGTVAGLFSLSKREAGYFNEEHLRLAEAMSSQASVAVENAVLFEQMQASTLRMQSLSRRLVEVQENERRRIARELHDEAGQALASLRYGLRLLEREVEQGGKVTERVAELMQRTDDVIDGLHRLAADLRPVSLDHLGLEAALRQYARSAVAAFGLTVRFKARGFKNERLPGVVETALYRVVQEAMANVVQHAHATQVDILAERRGERVMVMVEDNGVGFDPGRMLSGEHFGLLGLRERAQALGGTLTIESAPGSGTTVVVEVASVDPNPDR